LQKQRLNLSLAHLYAVEVETANFVFLQAPTQFVFVAASVAFLHSVSSGFAYQLKVMMSIKNWISFKFTFSGASPFPFWSKHLHILSAQATNDLSPPGPSAPDSKFGHLILIVQVSKVVLQAVKALEFFRWKATRMTRIESDPIDASKHSESEKDGAY